MYNYIPDIKKVESLQSVKVRGQCLIAAVANPPSRDDVLQ